MRALLPWLIALAVHLATRTRRAPDDDDEPRVPWLAMAAWAVLGMLLCVLLFATLGVEL